MDSRSDIERLKALLANPEGEVDSEWLRSMAEKYPFFSLPAATSLRQRAATLPEEERRRLTMLLSLSSSDPATLRRLVEPDGDRFDGFYPPEERPEAPSTDNAIDVFLDKYGNSDPKESELLERMIFNPVPDYASQLERQHKEETRDSSPAETASEQDELINRFIMAHGEKPREEDTVEIELSESEPQQPAPAPTAAHQRRQQQPEPAEDSLLSESLAKIYVKTGQYEQAYEIINRLSLAFPEKNAYFADQLRFLRKLILNKQFKEKEKTKKQQNK